MAGKHQYFISNEILYEGFEYPKSYRDFVSGDVPDLGPWEFQWDTVADPRYLELKERYPKRKLVPFAKRCDGDDLACFDATDPNPEKRVLLIHDFASEGWEGRGQLNGFLEWLEMAKADAEEWG